MENACERVIRKRELLEMLHDFDVMIVIVISFERYTERLTFDFYYCYYCIKWRILMLSSFFVNETRI